MRRTIAVPFGAIILVITLGLVTAMPSSTGAADGSSAGIPGVGLGSIHTIVGRAAPDGFVGVEALYADLQAEVEAHVRRAGIPVVSSFPTRLVVFVDIFGEDDRTGCRATIDVAVRQFALEPDTPLHPETPPLDTHHALWASCSDIDRLVREDTSDLVDRLLTVYRDPAPAATAGIPPRPR
jgi:hypothetical protein